MMMSLPLLKRVHSFLEDFCCKRVYNWVNIDFKMENGSLTATLMHTLMSLEHKQHRNTLPPALKAFLSISFTITNSPPPSNTHTRACTHTHHLVHLKYLSGTEVRGKGDGSGYDRDSTFKKRKKERWSNV